MFWTIYRIIIICFRSCACVLQNEYVLSSLPNMIIDSVSGRVGMGRWVSGSVVRGFNNTQEKTILW